MILVFQFHSTAVCMTRPAITQHLAAMPPSTQGGHASDEGRVPYDRGLAGLDAGEGQYIRPTCESAVHGPHCVRVLSPTLDGHGPTSCAQMSRCSLVQFADRLRIDLLHRRSIGIPSVYRCHGGALLVVDRGLDPCRRSLHARRASLETPCIQDLGPYREAVDGRGVRVKHASFPAARTTQCDETAVRASEDEWGRDASGIGKEV